MSVFRYLSKETGVKIANLFSSVWDITESGSDRLRFVYLDQRSHVDGTVAIVWTAEQDSNSAKLVNVVKCMQPVATA